MQIIGFNFEKIIAEKKNPVHGKIEIKSNINIKNISSQKFELIKDKDILKFDFELSIDYSPDISTLKFEGFLLATTEKEKMKEILKKWKTKKVSDDIRVSLFNIILTKCTLKALQLEEDLGLPTHIPMPKLQAEQQKPYVQ
jgi:hypothetical protein